jgi:catechol 2,3-dioxygenase-like lactoylglutathione lyase family enzyme
MSLKSAVQFATEFRIHMGLAVHDLQRSIAFYRTLLGREPTKVRPGYAKFEVAEPPVNLALNQVREAVGTAHPVAHFGIQVKSSDAVRSAAERLAAAGFPTEIEQQVTCCYAVQNKVWTADPDGNRWEVYVVLDDRGAHHHSSGSECCPDLPAMIDAVQHGDLAAAQAAMQSARSTSRCGCFAQTGA